MRIHRATSLVLLLAVAPDARAQLFVGGGLEYFSWSESAIPMPVRESGALLGFVLGYTQPKLSGFLFAYRGKLYFGAAAYDGSRFFAPDQGITATTGYVGTEQEGQVRYRTRGRVDLLAAIGGDFWRRILSKVQAEDYRVLFVAAGAEYNAVGPGWTFGAKLGYPVWTQLDAHARSIGFDQDPTLTPGQDLGGSSEVGYRFSGNWALIARFDLMRFKASNERIVTMGDAVAGGIAQPATSTYVLGIKAEFTR